MGISEIALGLVALTAFLWMYKEWNDAGKGN